MLSLGALAAVASGYYLKKKYQYSLFRLIPIAIPAVMAASAYSVYSKRKINDMNCLIKNIEDIRSQNGKNLIEALKDLKLDGKNLFLDADFTFSKVKNNQNDCGKSTQVI